MFILIQIYDQNIFVVRFLQVSTVFRLTEFHRPMDPMRVNLCTVQKMYNLLRRACVLVQSTIQDTQTHMIKCISDIISHLSCLVLFSKW